jgi:hypothetical protein
MTYFYEIVNVGQRCLLDCPIHEPIRIRYTIVKPYSVEGEMQFDFDHLQMEY